MRPIISIVGKSESGKTTLLESLISELKRRGHRIAVVKHTAEGFDFDQPSKDTWRFSEAGGDVVGISAHGKFALIKRVEGDLSPRDLSHFIRWDYDLLLTEGFKQSNNPKIEVHRREQGKDLVSPVEQLLAVVTDEPLAVSVPQFSRDQVQGLADLIEKNVKERSKDEDVELFVNETHVPLNPFVGSFLAKTLMGMVSSLKKVPEIKSLHIILRRKG